MKKLSILLSASLFIFISSCSTEKHNENHNQNDEASALDNSGVSVQLDNGNKWTANIETIQGIQKMTQMIDNASTQSDAGLRENMLLVFTDVLNKCTMKGESHEQLHNYLLPLKADIEKLSEPPTAEELENIKKYLITYYDYFN